ncbi:MAG: hypothetical protein M3Z16_12495 [Pseudomonadota bacterium]|nr:hypothetical protein [Pseudomonadota bacterium]
MNRRLALAACTTLLLAAGAAPAIVSAEPTEAGVMYRCPNNDYRNTLSQKEADKLGCKKLENAPVSVIQSVKPRPGSSSPPAVATSGVITRVDPSAQRARDSDARRILENELKAEEDRLSLMLKDFNNGEPERTGDEKNFQKYLDRVANMRTGIDRKQADIAALKRELAKLPAPRSP